MWKLAWIPVVLICCGCVEEKAPDNASEDQTSPIDSSVPSTDSSYAVSGTDTDTFSEKKTDMDSNALAPCNAGNDTATDACSETDVTDTASGAADEKADSDTAIVTKGSDGHSDSETPSTDTTSSDSDSQYYCTSGVAVVWQCDDNNNVVSLDDCGNTVTVQDRCGTSLECVRGACVCPMGYGGEGCQTPVLYVNAANGNSAASDGRSWATAFGDVQTALLQADTAETEIWVAKGRYYPGDTRESTFLLQSNVRLYGGFAGDERQLKERNIAANETILDGDIGQNDSETFSMHADNVYHVVTVTDGASLDGFTIRGGNANGDGDPHDDGGGLLAVEVSFRVANCTFQGNRADSTGGGLFMRSTHSVVQNCVFENNAAKNGGALGVASAGEPLDGNLICDSVFKGNVADSGGGALYVGGVDPGIDNCRFADNHADKGAGAYVIASENTRLFRSVFEKNHARSGGGMYNAGSRTLISNVVFVANDASEDGGAIRNDRFATTPGSKGSSVQIQNCTIVDNTTGGAFGAITSSGNSTPVIDNSIIWGNRTGEGETDIQLYQSIDAVMTISTRILQDGCTKGDLMRCGKNVFDIAPKLNGAEEDIWHPTADSMSVDKGDVAAITKDLLDLDGDGNITEPVPFDILGNPRITDGDGNGSTVLDLGAVEFTPN
ncbi:MAG: hypothetical protein JXR76_08190 [Deltaproteobacteria bacterium]|nr:hypothetical protein [Deltaproteobacteria bacterium]